MFRNIIILALVLIIVGCDDHSPQETVINAKQFGNKTIYVPSEYTNFSYASVSKSSGLIQAFYPGSAPVPGTERELRKAGEWHKNVRILFNIPRELNSVGVMNALMDLNKATHLVGEVHGLNHYSQSTTNSVYSLKDDVYVADESSGSFVICGKKQSQTQVAELCSHHFLLGKVHFKIGYDKRLLPEWKKIQENVVGLFNSFQNPETSSTHIKKFKQTKYVRKLKVIDPNDPNFEISKFDFWDYSKDKELLADVFKKQIKPLEKREKVEKFLVDIAGAQPRKSPNSGSNRQFTDALQKSDLSQVDYNITAYMWNWKEVPFASVGQGIVHVIYDPKDNVINVYFDNNLIH